MGSDNTENRCFLDTIFVRMLLPPLRKQVTQTCMLLIKGGFGPEVLPGVDVADLYECGDVRKFLNIVTMSNLFSEAQANFAYRLKQNRELLEKEEVIPDRVKTEVYCDAKALLESFPETGDEVENIERAWAYGVSFFLKRTKAEKEREQELESLRKRYEGQENELRVLRIQSDIGVQNQNPVADDLFFSEDEEEYDERAKAGFQKFNLFGNNYCFGLDEAHPSSIYGCEEATTSIVNEPKQSRQEKSTSQLSSQYPSQSNWGLGASLQYVDNSAARNLSTNGITTPSIPTFIPPAQQREQQPKKFQKDSKPETKPLSYSFAASRTPPPSASPPPPPPPVIVKKVIKEEARPVERVLPVQPGVTAVEVGYKLNYRQPRPDPRFKADSQMMMGPLPGHLTHEVAYLELRTSFAARGRVKFMYLSPSFLDHGGRSVKYGYVVFEEKADAQRILKDGFVTFLKKYQIKLKRMAK